MSGHHAILALASALLLASPGAGETLTQAVDLYAHPNIATEARRVENARLAAGHIEITLTSGSLAPVRAGAEEAGFFFRGKGSWRYTSECSEEFAVLRQNAAEVSRWKRVASGRTIALEDDFRELLWMGPERPSRTGPDAAPSLRGAFDDHVDYFSRLKFLSLPQRAVLAARAGASGSVSWGEFTGGRNEVLYVHDPLVRRAETIAVVRKAEFDSANASPELTLRPVSRQPLGATLRRPAEEPVRLIRVEAEIEAEGEHVKIATRETFVPAGAPAKLLRLNLRSRVFADSALDIRAQRLLRVEDESGRELSFDHRNSQLLVELPSECPAGEPVTLRFEMDGNVLFRPGRDSYWILGMEEWFPQPELTASAFTWKCRVRVKKPFVPLASGSVSESRQEGDWNVEEASIDQPISLPVVIAGDYHIEKLPRDGRTIRIASYAYRNARASRELADLAARVIAFYEGFLGPFPWRELTIIEINSYGFGVAPPATMFITQEAFSPHRDAVTRRFSRSLRERFAHEIAHQYWGHQIKWQGAEHEWLSESFADFCAALYIRQDRGEGSYRSFVRQWEGEARESGDRATVATANRLLGEKAVRHRANLLYGKGPWLLHALSREIGEERFDGFLGSLQSALRWQFATTDEIERRLEESSGRSFHDFFERYYWGTELPESPR